MATYEIEETKQYAVANTAVQEAAAGAVAGLEGKLKQQDTAAGTLVAIFNKTILGNVLGDRTEMNIRITPAGNDRCDVAVTVYPIDPVGRKLMFGARKGVSRTVLDWFWAHLEHRL